MLNFAVAMLFFWRSDIVTQRCRVLSGRNLDIFCSYFTGYAQTILVFF